MKNRVLSCVLAIFLMISIGSMTASATTIYGDVNNDGSISLSDVVLMNRYLSGSAPRTSINIKYSDVDKNMVIDVNDAKTITGYISNVIASLPHSESTMYNYSTYSLPADNARDYLKLDCSTGLQSTYRLSDVLPVSTMAYVPEDRIEDYTDNSRCIVRLQYGTRGGSGTGFIVSDHVIATAAHCLYDAQNDTFRSNFRITAYDDNGFALATYYPKEVHVPWEFIYENIIDDIYPSSNYDYGLIYVEEDLSAYGTMALGITTNQYKNTGQSLSISGFPYAAGGGIGLTTRYCGTGNVQSSSNSYYFETTVHTSSGQSGGPAYIEYTLNGETFRSAVGIASFGYEYNNGSWRTKATRITQPVTRFYMNNSNIG